MRTKAALFNLLAGQECSSAFDQRFFVDPDLFDAECRGWLAQQWVVIAHAAELAEPGTRLLRVFAGCEFLLVRGDQGQIRAFFSVCPHRGARLCSDGTASRDIVCTNHGWRFDLEGRAIEGAFTRGDNCPANLHLFAAPCCTVAGLVLCGLDVNQLPALDEFADRLAPVLDFHDMANAQVAARQTFEVDANWKLVLDTLLQGEVTSGGRTFARLNGPHGPQPAWPGATSVSRGQEGIALGRRQRPSDQPVRHLLGVGQTPLMIVGRPIGDGRRTLSRNGQALSRPMGQLREIDGGQTIFHLGHLSYLVAYDDYAVLLQINPMRADRTELTATWLLDGRAGEDVSIHEVCWAWQTMLEEDQQRLAQWAAGGRSAAYELRGFAAFDSPSSDFVVDYLNCMRRLVGATTANQQLPQTHAVGLVHVSPMLV